MSEICTDIQLHHGTNSVTAIGDSRNAEAILRMLAAATRMYKRSAAKVESRPASVNGHIEMCLWFGERYESEIPVEMGETVEN